MVPQLGGTQPLFTSMVYDLAGHTYMMGSSPQRTRGNNAGSTGGHRGSVINSKTVPATSSTASGAAAILKLSDGHTYMGSRGPGMP